jgi:peptidoglycan/xylan/chitin deacetylase (PgdA/CDA1 family)
MYHRIVDAALDPNGLAVSPGRFRLQMEALVERAAPVTLQRLAQGETRGADEGPAVAVTFDDGYRDNLTVAAPILERLGVPATFFVPSGAVGRTTGYWWDELQTIVFERGALPERLDIRLGGQWVSTEVGDDGGLHDRGGRHRDWRVWRLDPRTPRQRLYTALWQALLPLGDAEQSEGLHALAEWAGAELSVGRADAVFRPADLRTLSGASADAIGGHTVSHSWLPALPIEAQRSEIEGCRASLQALGAGEVRSFSYPYGAFTDETVAAVRECGFAAAVTTAPGVVTPRTDPLRMPRLAVEDWTVKRFLAELSSRLPR